MPNTMKYFPLLFLTFLASCGPKQQEDIVLFNRVSFFIKPDETSVNIDAFIRDEYIKYLPVGQANIPLFRYLQHDQYGIFIGLPFAITADSLHKIKPAVPFIQQIAELKDSSRYTYRHFINKAGLHIHTLSYQVNNSKVFVLGRTNNKTISDTVFSAKALTHRFQISKK
jgi:hypothetical protein